MALVVKEQSTGRNSVGQVTNGLGRQIYQTRVRQRRLHSKPKHFQKLVGRVQKSNKSRLGYFCFTRKQKISKFHMQMASLGSKVGGCSELPFGGNRRLLCQSPLESNWQVVGKTQEKQTDQVFDGNTQVGFSVVVAPTYKNANPKNKSNLHRTSVGTFCKLSGGLNAPPKWPLICVLLSGRCWRENKLKLKALKYI